MGELLESTTATVLLFAGLLTGLGIIWLKGVLPFYRRIRAAVHVIHRVTEAADRLLPFAEQQLRANGGSSLKDQLDRTETYAKGLTLRLEEIGRDLKRGRGLGDERHEENQHRFEAIEARLEAIDVRLAGEERHDG